MTTTQTASKTMTTLTLVSAALLVVGIILNLVFIITSDVSFLEFFQLNDFGMLLQVWDYHGFIVLTAPFAFLAGAVGVVAFGGQLKR